MNDGGASSGVGAQLVLPCIYCPNRVATAREHWIPRAFGNFRGYTPLLNRLCEPCNKALGHELDEVLARTGPTAFRREALGIRGRKKHTRVNPFHYHAMSAEPPNTLLMDREDGAGHLLGEVHGPGVARPMRQLLVEKAGRRMCVPFPSAWTAEHLREALKSRDLQDSALLEVYVEPGEDPQSVSLRTLLSVVFGKFDAMGYGYAGTGTQSRSTVRLKSLVGSAYARALAKVAFHYTLWAVPAITGHEPAFGPLKRFIRWGAGEPQHFVQMLATQMMRDLNRAQLLTTPHHLLTAYLHDAGVATAVRFFVDAEHPLPPSLCELAKGKVYSTREDVLSGHLITYWESPRDGYDGEINEVGVTLL